MQRREFLIGSAMAVGAAARAWGRARRAPPGAKTDRIAIMVYSFARVLKLPGRPSAPERTLEIFDVPEMFADRFKVHNVEMQHNYFESTEPSYFKDFLGRLAKTKSRVSNINLELGNMNIASADPALRAQAVDLTRAWIDHAGRAGVAARDDQPGHAHPGQQGGGHRDADAHDGLREDQERHGRRGASRRRLHSAHRGHSRRAARTRIRTSGTSEGIRPTSTTASRRCSRTPTATVI